MWSHSFSNPSPANLWLKIVISAIPVAAAVVHIVRPELKIDAVTFGLLVIALLPWLASLIESAKVPGGWEIKFRNLESAVQKVISEAPVHTATASSDQTAVQLWTQDKTWRL